jgi:hypothetical protein
MRSSDVYCWSLDAARSRHNCPDLSDSGFWTPDSYTIGVKFSASWDRAAIRSAGRTFHELEEFLENLNLRFLDFIVHVSLQNLKNKTSILAFCLWTRLVIYCTYAYWLVLVYHSSRKKAGGSHSVYTLLLTAFRFKLKKMKNQISDFFSLMFSNLQGT